MIEFFTGTSRDRVSEDNANNSSALFIDMRLGYQGTNGRTATLRHTARRRKISIKAMYLEL